MKHLRWFFFAGLLILGAASCSRFTPAAGGTQPPPTQAQVIPTAATPTEAAPTAAAPLEGEAFGQQLAQALQERDFDALRSAMDDRFLIAIGTSELRAVPAEVALDWLRQSYLAEGSAPQVQFSADVPALLGGTDPLGLWGPIANPVRAVHVTGLDSNASGQAVLVIGRDPATGEFFWLGLLVMPGDDRQVPEASAGN